MPPEGPRTRRRPRSSVLGPVIQVAVPAAVIFAVALRLIVVASMLVQLSGEDRPEGYVERFSEIATAEGRPYRDHQVEYPPVTVAAIELVGDEDVNATATRLLLLSVALDALTALSLLWGWGSRAAAGYLCGTLLVLAPIYQTLDILPVALASAGLALAHKRRERSGGALLAASVLAKVWPIALIPGLLVAARRRALAWCLSGLVAGAAVWMAWGGLGAIGQVATQRHSPGWEAESTVGVLVRILGDEDVRIVKDSPRVGVAPAWAKSLLAAATVVGVLAVWRRASRDGDPEEIGAPSLACVGVLLFFSPIYSYPYVLWLLPWAAIALVEGRTLQASLAVGAAVVTAMAYALLGGVVVRVPLLVTYLILLVRNLLTGAIPIVYLVRARQPSS